ncbi:MAG: HEPN domain-containing protein [Euryarchaeota archaeon]|nr:HEPN domain-containing protein [Euryarchaeota archaeon]
MNEISEIKDYLTIAKRDFETATKILEYNPDVSIFIFILAMEAAAKSILVSKGVARLPKTHMGLFSLLRESVAELGGLLKDYSKILAMRAKAGYRTKPVYDVNQAAQVQAKVKVFIETVERLV